MPNQSSSSISLTTLLYSIKPSRVYKASFPPRTFSFSLTHFKKLKSARLPTCYLPKISLPNLPNGTPHQPLPSVSVLSPLVIRRQPWQFFPQINSSTTLNHFNPSSKTVFRSHRKQMLLLPSESNPPGPALPTATLSEARQPNLNSTPPTSPSKSLGFVRNQIRNSPNNSSAKETSLGMPACLFGRSKLSLPNSASTLRNSPVLLRSSNLQRISIKPSTKSSRHSRQSPLTTLSWKRLPEF